LADGNDQLTSINTASDSPHAAPVRAGDSLVLRTRLSRRLNCGEELSSLWGNVGKDATKERSINEGHMHLSPGTNGGLAHLDQLEESSLNVWMRLIWRFSYSCYRHKCWDQLNVCWRFDVSV